MLTVRATALTDPEWLAAQRELAARLYGPAEPRVLGTIHWYSVSSVLVAPTVESLPTQAPVPDPALDAVLLNLHEDGRFAGARSTRTLEGGGLPEAGAALGTALAEAIDAIGRSAAISPATLWAIAADSVGNRLLWAGMATGDARRATALAGPLANAIGHRMPTPRYVGIGPNLVLRRTSCCLIYQATGGEKCVSCPHQHPGERDRRLRRTFGLGS